MSAWVDGFVIAPYTSGDVPSRPCRRTTSRGIGRQRYVSVTCALSSRSLEAVAEQLIWRRVYTARNAAALLNQSDQALRSKLRRGSLLAWAPDHPANVCGDWLVDADTVDHRAGRSATERGMFVQLPTIAMGPMMTDDELQMDPRLRVEFLELDARQAREQLLASLRAEVDARVAAAEQRAMAAETERDRLRLAVQALSAAPPHLDL